MLKKENKKHQQEQINNNSEELNNLVTENLQIDENGMSKVIEFNIVLT